MGIIGYLFVVLGIPGIAYGGVLGCIGFWRRDAQALVALLVGIFVVWVSKQLLAGEHFAPFFILPMLIAYVLATGVGFGLGLLLRRGYENSLKEAAPSD